MAQCKASELARFVSTPEKSFFLILLYGPDNGLVSESANAISKNLGFDKSDPFSIVQLDLDDIGADTAKLPDEAHAISMFGENKLIRLSGQTRRNIVPVFKSLLNTPPKNCWIIIESANLKKDSALRKLVEQSPHAMALPCYQDTAASLNLLIDQEIVENGISLTDETRQYLRSLLGEDRRTSRNELKKLALFAHGESEITQPQITQLLGNVSAVASDEIIDAVAMGNSEFLNLKLDQLFDTGTKPDMLLYAALRHFQMLHGFKAAMENSGSNPATLVASARPPVHFSRRNSVSASLRNWSFSGLKIALKRLDTAFLQARKNTRLASSIAGTCLLALTVLATRKN